MSPAYLKLPTYRPGEVDAIPRLPLYLPSPVHIDIKDPITDQPIELYFTEDHPFNRRGFRYVPCEATPLFSKLKYTQIEIPPYGPRVNIEDISMQILVDRETGTIVSTDKGHRMARANVGVREGKWYWECKILKGNLFNGDGNVRAGWTRREASLETPVGFDAYGYGVRDVTGQKFHISRGTDFMPEPFQAGDVIGFYISLPSISYQLDEASSKSKSSLGLSTETGNDVVPNIIRDRIPIKYKGQLYFEQFEYVPAKEFQDMLNQSSSDDVAMRETLLKEKGLLNSSIKVYKNGKFMGTPFEYLLPFLPPHSAPLSSMAARVVDDNSLGYYPSISVYGGGAAQFNFGPNFDFFPEDLKQEASSETLDTNKVRSMSERYEEQIAEDVVWDIVDEIDFTFNLDDSDDDDEDYKSERNG
ncbi:hypothetical protein V1514DRAFT_278016 [Lipomyces japonicus]|uniref:uncharacterized protein n=1 Tax=Lipomyces japonicus TaxID=56871 RepID=UPI0034CF7DD8